MRAYLANDRQLLAGENESSLPSGPRSLRCWSTGRLSWSCRSPKRGKKT